MNFDLRIAKPTALKSEENKKLKKPDLSHICGKGKGDKGE